MGHVTSGTLASTSDCLELGILVLSMGTGSVSLVLWELYFLFAGVSDGCTSQAVACLSACTVLVCQTEPYFHLMKCFCPHSLVELTADVYSILRTKGQKGAQEENRTLPGRLCTCICSAPQLSLVQAGSFKEILGIIFGVLEFQEYYNRDHNLTYIWTHPLLEFSPSAQELVVSLAAFDLKEKS